MRKEKFLPLATISGGLFILTGITSNDSEPEIPDSVVAAGGNGK